MDELFKDLQKQGQGLANLPGVANNLKAQLEPVLIQTTGMGKGLDAQIKTAMQGVTESLSQSLGSTVKTAASMKTPAPVPYRDAGGPTMPQMPVDGSLIQPKAGGINGLSLEMETIEDTFEKAIAQYDYPYADGADLEDMGQKAHKLRMRCYFYDNAEQETYDHHIDLINVVLPSKDNIDLMHPKYGLLKGKIESFIIQHDDRECCAVVDITFIEQMRGLILDAEANDAVDAAMESSYAAGQVTQEAKLAEDIKAALPKADSGIVKKALDSSKGLLAQVQEYSGKARSFVGAVEGYISTAESKVNQIMSPVNSLQATITYAQNLPGRILGDVTRSVEKVALLYTSLKNFPTRFISQLDDAFDALVDSFKAFNPADPVTGSTQQSSGQTANLTGSSAAAQDIMTTHLQIVCAQRLALEAATIYAADEEAFRSGGVNSTGMIYANADQASSESSDDATAASIQVMNIQELEETLAIVRSRIESAVEAAREMDGLKQMAEALLIHVNKVRLERERMVKITLDNAMPLHLVCLKYGLPYTDAERLLKVNRIRKPNFTSGEVYVYA